MVKPVEIVIHWNIVILLGFHRFSAEMHAHMRQSLQGEMGFIRLGFNEVGGSITRLQLCREKGD